MAKYEKRLRGDFQAFLDYLVDGVLNGSASASFEDGSDWEASGVRCASVSGAGGVRYKGEGAGVEAEIKGVSKL